MKRLLSLPPNLVGCFHEIEGLGRDEWFCTSDPIGARLGSGGGTAWLLDSCRKEEYPRMDMEQWLPREKRILMHAGGQSRRLPAYAPSGKILTPIPVFRWARGQKLSQNLLAVQMPFYEEIMRKVPDSIHTLIASGDVYIRNTQVLPEIPQADVICFGLWAEPSLATNHGIFVSRRNSPESLDFMLQKPSLKELSELSGSHLFLMDIGIWLLSDKAVSLLMDKSRSEDWDSYKEYDLYGDFGLSLGHNPTVTDPDLKQLTVSILPLNGGEFYHYGTSRELISSTLAVQNLVNDQRLIMHRKVKPHPAMFVQNAEMHYKLTADNSEVWIENSFIGARWEVQNKHIITGVPVNDWKLTVPATVCIDVVPLGIHDFVARPYGFHDRFNGATTDENTLFMGVPLSKWAEQRGINILYNNDIQKTPLFPVCPTVDDLGVVLRWMICEPGLAEGRQIWERAVKLSANQLTDQANLSRLTHQREAFRRKDWSILAQNYERSVFYQLDLSDAAITFAKDNIPLPEAISPHSSLITQMSDAMFRAQVLKHTNKPFEEYQQKAFEYLHQGLTSTLTDKKQSPSLCVYPDQIVWGRSPVRIDLAGGWTDTPPFCLYEGGNVVNVAIELNGQPPLQVYIKPSKDYRITLRSIDLGAMEVVTTWDELRNYKQVGSPFSIPKAALCLAGFTPEFAEKQYSSLEKQLTDFGCGIEITLLSAVPAGSGLGTSSILAATVLGTLSDFCGLGWDLNETGNRTVILEQLLTTGGGWQDPYGGILHGIKLLQTNEGFRQYPRVSWLPEYLFTETAYQSCHLLYYTGLTRTAKDILAEIVRAMFLNSHPHLSLLSEMKAHALEIYKAIQNGDFNTYGKLIGKTWEQKKALDRGTNPPAVEAIIQRIKDYCLGYELPGAGGGGYLYMVAKDPEAAIRIRNLLTHDTGHPHSRFVEMNLSGKGLQISRS